MPSAQWPKTLRLLSDCGLGAGVIEDIARGQAVFDLVSWEEDGKAELMVIDLESGGTQQGPRLSEAQADKLLETWEFERRIAVSEDTERPATFSTGDYDDWTGIRPNANWQSLIREYRTATETLGRHLSPGAAAPYLFLCRHTLELQLKAIIMVGQEAFGLSADLPAHHELSKLWTAAYPMLKALGLNDENGAVRQVVDDYDAADPRSFSFRYPRTSKNQPVQHEPYVLAFGKAHHEGEMRRAFAFLDNAIHRLRFRAMSREIVQAKCFTDPRL